MLQFVACVKNANIARDYVSGVAVCCSVLQRFAVCCSVLQHVAACCSVVAVCCSLSNVSRISISHNTKRRVIVVLQCVLQNVAV